MRRFVVRSNLPFRGVAKGHSFGHAPALTFSTPSEERLFAFAVTERSRPHVFEFSNDEEGLQELANLIRSEEVQAVVKGVKTQFELVSLVEVAMGGHVHQDRLPIPRNP